MFIDYKKVCMCQSKKITQKIRCIKKLKHEKEKVNKQRGYLTPGNFEFSLCGNFRVLNDIFLQKRGYLAPGIQIDYSKYVLLTCNIHVESRYS